MLNKEKDRNTGTKETNEKLKEAQKAKSHGQCSAESKSDTKSEKQKGQSCSMEEDEECEES